MNSGEDGILLQVDRNLLIQESPKRRFGYSRGHTLKYSEITERCQPISYPGVASIHLAVLLVVMAMQGPCRELLLPGLDQEQGECACGMNGEATDPSINAGIASLATMGVPCMGP